MRPVLLAENEDSFTWNVVECLPFERGRVVVVPGAALAARPGDLAGASALVIGPGPKDPLRAGVVSLVGAAIRHGLPVLGVCLGHQAIGLAFGASLVRVRPAHGVVSPVRFQPSRWFPGVTGLHACMRYHSLALAGVVTPLRVIATLEGGMPMAIEHEDLPVAGLQFHPDSHGSPSGRLIVESFFRAAGLWP